MTGDLEGVTTVEAKPGQLRAMVYDGTNLPQLRQFLGRYAAHEMDILSGAGSPYVRLPGKPDHMLMQNDAILIDDQGWPSQVSAEVFARRYRLAGSQAGLAGKLGT